MVKSFLKRYRKLKPRPNANGFTLLELLVAMVVGSLISMGLLFIVVQLAQTNQRESARSDTQRDLQAAIDYIARDLREAVFVYDTTCLLDRPTANTALCPGLRNYLPAAITGTSGFGATTGTTLVNVPVLAFWRVEPLPDAVKQVCYTNRASYSAAPPLPAVIQNVPCLSGRMYTLVVYSLNRETTGRAVARGRARIMRYELPQYTSGSVASTGATPTITTGWVDPKMGNSVSTTSGSTTTTTFRETTFLSWPVEKSSLSATSLVSLQTGTPVSNNVPLTDFVDWDGLYVQSGGTVSKGRAPDRSAEGLVLTPANDSGTNATADPPRGFYVYVRGGTSGGDLNQEVVIRIQGDAAGRPGVPLGSTGPIVPISLETRVLTRGVTNKTL